MTIECVGIDRFVVDAPMRLPFGFGSATVTHQPHLMVTMEVEIDGDRSEGIAADGLSPQWFLKDTTFDRGLRKMTAVIEAACRHARETPPQESVYAAWREIYDRQRVWAEQTEHPPLLWSYGVTLIERCLIDAYCRYHERSFRTVIQDNELAIPFGDFHPELRDAHPRDLLPEEETERIAVRHTVAHNDPLTDDDLTGDLQVDDGLPVTLEEFINADGISYFKLKLFGEQAADLRRLSRIASVIETQLGTEYSVTMDANEQFEDIASFKAFWEAFREAEELAVLRSNTRYVEQPLPRDEALTAATASTLSQWDEAPPIIIDESDAELDSCREALSVGYNGTSHKNVKGIIKSVANYCYIENCRRANPEEQFIMSAEDASNIGPVSLLQDLAVVGTLGFDNVERNGHRCFEGLSMFPEALQSACLSDHHDVFSRTDRGIPAVSIQDGLIAMKSVMGAPFGYTCHIPTAEMTRYTDWKKTIEETA